MTRTTHAVVETIAPLTDTIVQLVLKPDTFIDYAAGQYIKIPIKDQALCYSIANAPLGSHHYELHIRHSRNNLYNEHLFAHIKQHGSVTLQVPFGECSLDHLDRSKPILFIALGTGFAPAHAMIEQLLARADPRRYALFWSARAPSDLYLDEKVTHWQTHSTHFDYYPLVDVPKETLVSTVLDTYANNIASWQTMISGPFDTVHFIRDRLVAQGMPLEQIYSDAFSFT